MGPALVIGAVAAAAAAGIGVLKLRQRNSLAGIAASQNANTQAILAQAATLKAQGIVGAGAAPRPIEVGNLLRTTSGIAFSKTSPAGFLGVAADPNAASQIGNGDILTVDVVAGSMTTPASPSGNRLVKVIGAFDPASKTIPVVSIDPRISDTTTKLLIPVAAITDAVATGADFSKLVVGMGQ